ncbi:MAG: hypothetical protein M1837_002914, partial [Sclerophora amabilis]
MNRRGRGQTLTCSFWRQPEALKDFSVTGDAQPSPHLISYSFQGNILICRICQYAMGLDSFDRHLRNPHGLPLARRVPAEQEPTSEHLCD